MAGGTPRVAVFPTDELPQDEGDLRHLMASFLEATVPKLYAGDPEAWLKAGLKLGCNALVGGTVAKSLAGLTPLQWVLRSFGPMPVEYVTYRATPVIEFTLKGKPTLAHRGAARFLGGSGTRLLVGELSAGSRLLRVGRVVGARFLLVTAAFEGGYLVGTLINEHALEDDTKNVVGGVMNQIINEGGWRLAIPSVVREALGIPGLREEVDLSAMR